MTRWYGLATDGSDDENDKFLPVLLKHLDKDSGLIGRSLLEISNINNGSTEYQMYLCTEVREAFSLDWGNCVKCNTNSII